MPCNQPSEEKRNFHSRRAVNTAEAAIYIQDASKKEAIPLYRTGLSSRFSTDKWTFTAKEQSEGQRVDDY